MLRGKTDAETCRLNGWTVGTVLVGDEGDGPEKNRITAIGETAVMAKGVEDKYGNAVNGYESAWSLVYREWAAQE